VETPTLRAFYEDFKKLHYPNIEATTHKQYDHIIRRYLLPEFGDKPMGEIKDRDIAIYFNTFVDRPYLGNFIMRVLRKVFSVAEDYEAIPRGTAPRIKYRREEPRTRYPDDDEAKRLWEAVRALEPKDPMFSLLTQLLAHSGARPGELEQAQWEWIKSDGIHLPKAKWRKKGRVITLSKAAFEVLDRVPGERVGNVFEAMPGRQFNKTLRCARWKKLLRVAKIDGLQQRDLRRWFASLALSNGVPLEAVGQLLGHRSANTTKIYAVLMKDERSQGVEAAAEKLARILDQDKDPASEE